MVNVDGPQLLFNALTASTARRFTEKHTHESSLHRYRYVFNPRDCVYTYAIWFYGQPESRVTDTVFLKVTWQEQCTFSWGNILTTFRSEDVSLNLLHLQDAKQAESYISRLEAMADEVFKKRAIQSHVIADSQSFSTHAQHNRPF